MMLFHEDVCLLCGKPISEKLKTIAESRGTPARFCSPAHRNAWNVKNSRLRSKGSAVALKATHKGNFKEPFGIDVECYVLDDEAKTAVISQRGMGAALGLGEAGNAFPKLLSSQTVSRAIGSEILRTAKNPLVFQGFSAEGSNLPPTIINGYDVALLIDFCKAVLAARSSGALGPRYDNIAKQAQIIIGASAKAGIKGLVYALAGYDATREEIIENFKRFVAEEAREYEREFPEQLYQEWYRIYELTEPASNRRPWKFKHLTVDQVYHPLAKSNGLLLDLLRVLKAKGKDRYKKLHQFLSEIGVKALRTHLGQLLGIAQLSPTKADYEKNFEKVFKEQLPLNLG
jgi:hypothetical protein